MQKKYIEDTTGKEKFRRSINTLVSMVNRNVHNQYRNSVLGILWTVLNPLLNMAVIALVFSMLLMRDQQPTLFYPVYILSGNIIFGMMRMGTTTALPCMVRNYDLLTKTRLVHEIFPLSNVLSAVVNFFFSFIALLIVMLVFHNRPGVGFHWTLLMTFLPFLPIFVLFILGLSFVLSTIYIRFRDIQHLYTVLLTLWMYLTPVFYTFDVINKPEYATVLKILKLNPMYHFVTYFRDILTGSVPSLAVHGIILAWGIGSFLIGFLFFHFSKKKFLLHI